MACLTVAGAVRGAEPDHWAFQQLTQPAIPTVKNPDWPITKIDHFILAKLQARDIKPSPRAENHVLVRRAYLDLIGLPPTPEEIAAFAKDLETNAQSAYEKLLDRLLESPHFGERWGRHWLDGAGYVDVVGGDNDAATIKRGENKWRYRDWVIGAFNRDQPFDRFLREQIAGDELVDWRNATAFTPEMRDTLIATGFLRTAADDTDENELNTLDIRHGVLQRTTEVIGNNLLALTIQCAKCHDHKYEPISQRDYYRLIALLQPALNPDRWLQPKERLFADIPAAQKAEIDKHNVAIDKELADLNKRLAEVKKEGKDTTAIADLEKQVKEVTKRKRGWNTLHVITDAGPPTPTRLLVRGDHTKLGDVVEPGFLRALCSTDAAAILRESKDERPTSGRRTALANWMTNPKSHAGALVLRVRVNRIWQHLFGRGIVETADNFGRSGAKPTHPELLDWLANQFVDDGQRIKPFVKRLMLSAVYRQASASTVEPPAADPDNALLWKMRLRRLESEIVRDSLLAVAGKLDRTRGGPPVELEVVSGGTMKVKGPGENRRTVYLLGRRNYHLPILNVFDQPNLTTNCTRRASSAVVLQSLALLNEPFVHDQAKALAERIAAVKPGAEIDRAFTIVLGRSPTVREITACAEHVGTQNSNYLKEKAPPDVARRKALTHLWHMLVNTSEFLHTP